MGTLDKKRRVNTCSPDHECTMEEINTLIQEYGDIQNDLEIAKYSEPNIADLQEIVDRANGYTGQWYHSYVLIRGCVEEDAKESLKAQILSLGAEHGIYYAISYSDENTSGLPS